MSGCTSSARTPLRAHRIDAIIDRGDLLGDGLQVNLAGAHVVKSANNLVGDLFNDFTVDGRSRACLKLGLKRAQQGLDRIEINRRPDRVEPRAKLAEHRVQLPRANLRVSEAVELIADFGEY